jgi:hypothetical protein
MPHHHLHQTEPRPGYISSRYAMGMELDGAKNQSGGVSGIKAGVRFGCRRVFE